MMMSQSIPAQFSQVTVPCKANIYFEGKVVSHSLLFADGSKKTLGLIYPGSYRFDTAAPERMDIVAGRCRARLAGKSEWNEYAAGSGFAIPGNSHFDIAVDDGVAEYLCSFG
jgi:hypothetical protein